MRSLEITSTREYQREIDSFKVYDTLLAGHRIVFERHTSWLTAAVWTMRQGYGLENFLRVAEETLKDAESHGWESDSSNSVHLSTTALEGHDSVFCDVYRPLETTDLENLNIDLDVMGLKIKTDIGSMTFDPITRHAGVMFDEKPHQTRSAFRFMHELLPLEIGLSPQEIGGLILALPRLSPQPES